MKLLIIYGSTEGQTRRICQFLREEAEARGHKTELNDSSANPASPAGFDTVIIGASLHYGKYQSSIEHYIREHLKPLNEVESLFLSVSMAAASKEPKSQKELEEITSTFLEETGWRPGHTEQVAGALRYTEYNFFKKFIMRMIAHHEGGSTDTSGDHEYTDWNQVRSALGQLEKKIPAQEGQST